MPPPSNQKADIEPPPEVTEEGIRGFLAGAFQYGAVSILAHTILILPHPFTFSQPGPPATPETPAQPRRPSPFSGEYIRSRFFHRPLEGFSEWLSPTARIYRGLTPQFKVFLQIAAMTLGGCVWAERRVTEYIDLVRRAKRAERIRVQRERLLEE